LLRHQFADGHAVHTYFPEDKQAPWRTIHSDDHLWLPMVAHALVVETGDLNLLDETIPFLAENGVDAGADATVWEHLLAALDFTAGKLGKHDIPLTLHSDWNDCIGRFAREGKGESVFAAQQYVFVLRQMISLAGAKGDFTTKARLQSRLDEQVQAITRNCWDGEWWVRGFDDAGLPLGSKTSNHGHIWLNSQSWSVLADIGTNQQQISAMDSVRRLLNTERGIKKIHPSFPTYPEDMDAFVGYSLGCGENGAIFCHANTWAIIAEAMLGRGEQAWQYFHQLVPHLALQSAGIERYQAEPYAWASSIVGPENPRFGWANVPHVTGTAAWMDIAATQYLLGIRPELEGLRLAPVLPADWNGFSATRRYRNCQCDIEVRRARSGEESGLRVDGRLLNDNLVPATALTGLPSAKLSLILAD
jgi:cellobiose phosphorylase